MGWFICVVALILPVLSFGHGGGLDSYGCHNNRQERVYQCHEGANAGGVYASKDEMLRSIRATDQTDQDSIEVIQGKVIAITDGDTATILMNNTQYKIRLA